MKNSVFMEEMDAFTYREKLAKDAVVFIPVGALEQHGSHMAMCVDAALTKAMAGATAEALTADTDGALEGIVCSAINFGYRSQQRSGGGSTCRARLRCRVLRSSLWPAISAIASSRTALARSCS